MIPWDEPFTNKVELLAPAGNYKNGLIALYSGADAIYLAYKEFGARAYADNFSLEEIKKITETAHVLQKKVYVVVNTTLKQSELECAYELVTDLLDINVDGIITTDPAIIDYLSKIDPYHLHISTQVGVKNLNDVLFFDNLGAKRVVLARETSIDTIKEMKKNSKMDLEVFLHGALCVSYSGGCLLSSVLSLRSGNRGRCSQNCRRLYDLYEDGKKIASDKYLLSMKDLNSVTNVKDLVNSEVSSLKIEGRMKNSSYVKNVVSYYRSLVDYERFIYLNDKFPGIVNPDNIPLPNDKSLLESIFHRKFTKGFLGNEDRGSICDINSPSNEGLLVGKVVSIKGDIVTLNVNKEILVGDRIKFDGETPQYLTIDNLTNDKGENVNSGIGLLKTQINFKLNNNGNIIKMIDSSIDDEVNTDIIPICVNVSGELGDLLEVKFSYHLPTSLFDPLIESNYYGKMCGEFIVFSNVELEQSFTKPLTKETIIEQFSKLHDTPFYLDIEHSSFNIPDNVFIPVRELNSIRRQLVNIIFDQFNGRGHKELPEGDPFTFDERKVDKCAKINVSKKEDKSLGVVATCVNEEQYKTLLSLGIKDIYYKNRSTYTDSSYKDIESNKVMIGSYGGFVAYKNKDITTDYSFNIMNSDSIKFLLNNGANHVTLSYEISKPELKEIYDGFVQEFGYAPELDYIVYGRQNLMTTEYCPLKQFGKCGECNKHQYYLKDNFGTFHIMHEGCKTHILNGDTTNLLGELKFISPYVSRIRLDFTTESSSEIKEVINDLHKALKGEKVELKPHQTRGYFNRPIL